MSLRAEVQAEMSKGLENNPVLLRMVVYGVQGQEMKIPAEEVAGLMFEWMAGVQRGVLYLADKVEELCS